jgi:hypothetical protein
MTSVFISYRRSDCPGHAGRLYDRIVDRVGSDRVFMDIDAIPPGVDFTEHIERAIDSCAIVLALIGNDWLGGGDRGGRRLEHPDDFVRFEIAAALRRPGLRVIPVLVEGAEMPVAANLPADIQMLARRNAFELRDAHWRHDVDRLLKEVTLACDSHSPADPVDDGQRWRPLNTAVIAAAAITLIAVIAVIPPLFTDDPPAPIPTTQYPCSDRRDNDEDGKTDFPSDDGCSSPNDRTEKTAACADGKDNDGDGKTDLRDEDCLTKEDTAETT